MLRTAFHLLLALVLCLNGVFAPVAMAQHGALQADGTQAAMPCHDMAGDKSMSPGHDGMAHHDDGAPAKPKPHHPDCCKHGQCLCSGVAANIPALPALAQAAMRSRLALPAVQEIGTSRYAVALRPPIA